LGESTAELGKCCSVHAATDEVIINHYLFFSNRLQQLNQFAIRNPLCDDVAGCQKWHIDYRRIFGLAIHLVVAV
jgi:hypothetical protein